MRGTVRGKVGGGGVRAEAPVPVTQPHKKGGNESEAAIIFSTAATPTPGPTPKSPTERLPSSPRAANLPSLAHWFLPQMRAPFHPSPACLASPPNFKRL
eukprot:3601029-Pleurochrysis_carterae.AAC.1